MITAIPPTLLAIAIFIYALLNVEALRKAKGYTIPDISAFVILGLVAAALLSSIVFAIVRIWELAKGTGFGSGIGLVVFIIYFVVLSALYG